ncbi:MAG: Mur ligase domain-containing protein, partial [Vicinamibacterales bacterium]
MRLAELVAGLDACVLTGDPDLEIASIEFDSRQVQPGTLFVALRGGYTDGHLYLHDARARGAAAVFVEDGAAVDTAQFAAAIVTPDTRALLATIAARFYGHSSRSMTVIGVTGTDGKTTTAHFIESLCR